MRKLGFIAETEKGDSLAYNVFATENLSKKECWTLAILNGFEIVPADSTIIRFELEFEEAMA